MKNRKRDARNYEVLRHEMAMLKAAPEERRRRAIESMTVKQMLHWDADFETWAHENQLPPNAEGWRVWLMMAGRGFGKTRAGAEWIYRLAAGKAGVRIALAGASIADARSIMVEGVSGLLSVARRYRRRLTWEPSLGRLKWPNGSEVQLFSGDHADGLRGPEFDFAWALQTLDLVAACPVEEVPRSTPPASPALGSCYIVGSSPSGAWAGKVQYLAGYTGGGWRLVSPLDGMSAYVKATGTWANHRAGSWELGALRGANLVLGGVQVVGPRLAAIAAPAGGTNADPEARLAINQILSVLRQHGLIES